MGIDAGCELQANVTHSLIAFPESSTMSCYSKEVAALLAVRRFRGQNILGSDLLKMTPRRHVDWWLQKVGAANRGPNDHMNRRICHPGSEAPRPNMRGYQTSCFVGSSS